MLVIDQLKRSDPKLRVVAIGIAVCMGILSIGLWYVQIVSAKRFQANLDRQSFRIVRVPAARGKIYDRNGLVMADNRPSHSINLYLEELRQHFNPEYKRLEKEFKELHPGERVPKEMERVARFNVIHRTVARLAAVLEMPELTVTEAQVNYHYEKRRAFPMTIAKDLTPEQIARFWEKPFNHTGIDLNVLPARQYPFGSTAAHVLGYLRVDDGSRPSDKDEEEDLERPYDYHLPGLRGDVVGIEGVYDEQLRGLAGERVVVVNNIGYRVREMERVPVEAGQNVTLTLDVEIQQAAELALRNRIGPHVRGAVAVVNPQNGDILALASAPTYNPNDFPGISYEDYSLLNNPEVGAFRNRATQDIYHPGSTFKIVTALACLEKGIIDPEEEYYNPGFYRLGPRSTIDDTAARGYYNFNRAFYRSSNSYFIHYALAAGPRAIIDMGQRFFLGQRTGIPTRQDSAGNFPDLDDVKRGWYDGTTANMSIGQGPLDCTPLQMAYVAGAVVNGGTIYQPRLVIQTMPQEAKSGRGVMFNPTAQVRGRLGVRQENLDIVRHAMVLDVENSDGTGKEARVGGMIIGGKTGTAEVKPNNRAEYKVTWFVAFGDLAAQRDPRYAIACVVEFGGSGGKTCAPVVGEVFQAIKRIEINRASSRMALTAK